MKKNHFSQRGAMLVALTTAQGLLATAAYADLGNVIDSNYNGNVNLSTYYQNFTITGQGTVYPPSGSAVALSPTAHVDEFLNQGHINNWNGHGIKSEGFIGTLNNSGSIEINNGIQSANAIYLSANSQTTNLINSGTITNTYDIIFGPSVGNAAIVNDGNVGTFTNLNNGHINGTTALRNNGLIDVFNNDGNIDNANIGPMMPLSNATIINSGTINTFNNTGIITSSNNYLGPVSSSPAIQNTGTITTINNYGTISSTQTAIQSTNAIENLHNEGTIKGNISVGGTTPLNITGGASAMGTLTGAMPMFGIFAPNPIVQETVGTLSAGGDIDFKNGSILLNDNVITGGTVFNSASTLQVNQPIAINGNYHQKQAATLVIGVSDAAIANGDPVLDVGYGRLNVTGTAIIDAGSHVNLVRKENSYAFARGQRYVVVDASAGGTQYHADQLNYQAAGYTGAVKGKTLLDGSRSALVVSLVDAPVTPEVPVTPQVPVTPDVSVIPQVPVVPVTPTVPDIPAQPAPTTQQPGFATTRNATSALSGLSSYGGISPQLLELYNASLAINDTEEANRVGERLSPGQSISTGQATQTATASAYSVIGNHMDSVRSPQTAGMSGVSTGDDYSDWLMWAQPFGGYARQDTTDQISGYSAKFGGLLIGADRALTDAWRLGAAVNYSNTSVHGKDNLQGNTSTADNYGLIGYASYTGEPWFMNLSAGVNRQNYDTSRIAEFTGFSGQARGKFNGQSTTVQGEFGYPFALGAKVTLTPLASLSYSYQHIDGYQETGGNGMALDVDASHSQSVVSDIGARLDKTFETGMGNLTPFIQLSWIHQYDKSQMSNTATYAADSVGETTFVTKGASPIENMAGVAIGSTLYDAHSLSVDARYDLQAGENYQAHNFSLRLRKTF
ncbi:autotransporter domain-containing protein [Atlantibacter sp.]|uniref:autotransporter family protein n=1 Tax=Atlantibacter sp. TaxID=1903473 RepID=UPI00289A5352|nr:autotransporter domain-containing protein [Atlantibacter sp.]